MQRRPTLKWFFPLGLAALWLVFTALGTWHNLERRHAQLVHAAHQDAQEHAAHLARMAEQGLQTNRLLVESDLAHISADPRVSHTLVLDEEGRILMAPRHAWTGQSIQQALPQLGDSWRQLTTASRLPQVRPSANGLGLLVLHPFELPAHTDEVRSSRRGAVLVQMDLHPTWLHARHDTLLERLPSLLTALLLLLATGWLLQRHVVGPIQRLASAVGLLRQGQLGTRAEVQGPRELAELAADVNAMAQTIETAQHALATSEQRLSVTLHSIGDGLIATDPRERITLMNPAAEVFTGWTLPQAMGRSIEEVFRIENAMTGQPTEIPIKRVLTEGTVLGLANHTVLIAKDGTRRHIADSAAPIRNAQGNIEGVVLVFHDETERHRMRLALADSEQHFRNLANSGQALIWTSGLDKKCNYFNVPWLKFTGRRLEQEMGDGWVEGVHPEDLDRCMVTYVQAFDARQPFAMEYRLRHASGEYRWILDQGNPRFDSQGHFLGYVGHCLDLTQVKQAEARVAHLAYHDTLTGLPNRALFHDRLTQALAAAQRSKRVGALMFIDLDHFKRVNDVYGHAVGDTVLREVSKRLQYFLRTEDSVARLGGDEFVVLLPALASDPHGAATLARVVGDKIRTALEAPIHIDGMAYHTAASLGVTLFPKGAQTVDDLMREADIAMYRAKEGGRNAVSFFQLEMQHSVTQRYELEQELRDAVAQQTFELYLQSQVNSAGQLTGAEALVRWRHPTRGLVSPATFIPLAEETRLILPLGEWVLQQACQVIAQLGAAGHSLHIAVNVSPLQFAQEHFVQKVRDILASTGADPSYLTLEITEGLLVEHMAETMGRMSELATLGIRFSIDDFGTGYSSLAYLKRLPLYELKIDKSFVQDIPDDPNDVALVQTILAMAHHLHLSVVAEGVETTAQFELLKANGCHRYQGYHFHRPQHHRDWLAALPQPAQR
ncbi:MAG: EAL domain-containing protein [Burkholderiales bacterium]|nr:EAL domain-containing protein [Burkholderiales bacterium]